ncbi:TetR/AcrR family transcriptional regulator [Streptomyces sp. NPDC013171]|uniref:TetR/AcrR family transcriptional regulator n=1 Tax=Streptomyces sp. NPDC013171 TaxID=3364863 RepID=UPI00369C6B4D
MIEPPAPEARTNRRGRRSRQEILDAAARVMSVRGYAGTSMSTLTKETGLPKSAFYHHFESKAGLLSAVMEQGAHAFFDAMREAHRNPPRAAPPTSGSAGTCDGPATSWRTARSSCASCSSS